MAAAAFSCSVRDSEGVGTRVNISSGKGQLREVVSSNLFTRLRDLAREISVQHQVKRKPKQWRVTGQRDRKRLGRNGPDSRMSVFFHISILQMFRCILKLLGTLIEW